MIICFKEKHGDRFVEGPDLDTVLAYILSDRLSDTYGAMFGGEDDGVSVWYDDDTDRARRFLGTGRAAEYMGFRRRHEYEDWYEVPVEKIEASQ